MDVENTLSSGAMRLKEILSTTLMNELVSLAYELEGNVKRSIRDVGAIAFGTMEASMSVSTIQRTGGALHLRVGSPLDYPAYVEFGTKPHWPPLKPIQLWVEKKFGTLAVRINFVDKRAVPVRGIPRWKTRSIREREVLRIARAIMYKMSKQGTRGQRYYRRALEQMGLPYTLTEEAPYLIFQIDALPWIEKRGFWERVDAAMKGSAA